MKIFFILIQIFGFLAVFFNGFFAGYRYSRGRMFEVTDRILEEAMYRHNGTNTRDYSLDQIDDRLFRKEAANINAAHYLGRKLKQQKMFGKVK